MGAIREELARLLVVEERHRRLASRIALVMLATTVVDLLGAVAMDILEAGAAGSQIHTFGQALFFASVQVVTVSSSLSNPVTPAGRVVDVLLEIWGVLALTGIGGAVATFFLTGDR
jgi:voltage-gated potassium channel